MQSVYNFCDIKVAMTFMNLHILKIKGWEYYLLVRLEFIKSPLGISIKN